MSDGLQALFEKRLWLCRNVQGRFKRDREQCWRELDQRAADELLCMLQDDAGAQRALETSLGMPLLHFVAGCAAPFIPVVHHLVRSESVDQLWRQRNHIVAPLHSVRNMAMLYALIVECGANVDAPGSSVTPLTAVRMRGDVMIERALYAYGGHYGSTKRA